jgi:hypothetical protein
MRELIGLTGRAYLEARVNASGEASTDSWSTKPRIQHLAERYMECAFKTEIEKATNAAIAEVKNAIAAQHKAFLEAKAGVVVSEPIAIKRSREAAASRTRSVEKTETTHASGLKTYILQLVHTA